MTNIRCEFSRSHQVTAGDDETIRVVGREFGRDAPPDDTIATYECPEHASEIEREPP
jgi:hypothetical protein